MERRQILLKLEGLPVDTTFKDINRFFKDPNISKEDINILHNENMKCVGIAYVRFSSKMEVDSAYRHCSNSIRGSHVTFKETNMSEMVATRAKIEGRSSSAERRVSRPVHPPFNSRLTDNREREEARRLPFSRYTLASSDGLDRVIRSRSRSPLHRPEVRRDDFSNHRPGEPYRHEPVERHNGRRPRFTHSPPPPRHVFQGREEVPRVRSPQRRRVEEGTHVLDRLADRREDPTRRVEREGPHRRGEHLFTDEVADQRRSAGSTPQLDRWREESRREGRTVIQQNTEGSEGLNPSRSLSSVSRGKRGPVPTAVAKMYELKVMGFPLSYSFRDIRRALGTSVKVSHDGIELVAGAHRPTAYVLVVGVGSYDAALAKDGFQLDRNHTLTVLPANRAKDADTNKVSDDDLRDMLDNKTRYKEEEKQPLRSPSPRPSSKKVSSSTSSSRRRDEDSGRRRMEDARPRRDEVVVPGRDKIVGLRRNEDIGQRRSEDTGRRGDKVVGPKRDDDSRKKSRELDRSKDVRRDKDKDERRGRERDEQREVEKRERREKEVALDQQRNKRLEEPGYIDKLWNSMDFEPCPRHLSRARTNPDHSRSQLSPYNCDESSESHSRSKAGKQFISSPQPQSRLDSESLLWENPNSHDDIPPQSGLSKPDSEDFIPLSRESFDNPEVTSLERLPSDPLYGADTDSYRDRPQVPTNPYAAQSSEGSLPGSLGYSGSQFLSSPLQVNPYLYHQQQAVLDYSAQQQGLARAGVLVPAVVGLPGGVQDHSSLSLLARGVTPEALTSQQHTLGRVLRTTPGQPVGYTPQTLTRPYNPTTFTAKPPDGSKLSSVAHIVNKTPSLRPATVVPKPPTIINQGSSALTLTQLGLGAGAGPGGHHMLRITGVPPSTTIQDVIAFLLDHTISFNDVRIQCTDMGQPTGKVFVTYRSYTQASEKVKALSGSLLKQTKVTLDVV